MRMKMMKIHTYRNNYTICRTTLKVPNLLCTQLFKFSVHNTIQFQQLFFYVRITETQTELQISFDVAIDEDGSKK